MPTQAEIDNVLSLAATYQEKRAISNEAQALVGTATARANTSRSSFDAMVEDGEADTDKLTNVLIEVSETGLDAAAKQTDASTKSTQASQAYSAMSDAILALTTPPPEQTVARATGSGRDKRKAEK